MQQYLYNILAILRTTSRIHECDWTFCPFGVRHLIEDFVENEYFQSIYIISSRRERLSLIHAHFTLFWEKHTHVSFVYKSFTHSNRSYF